MRPLSATEAISPAIERAKAILRPFSLGLWIKLGFVAILAELTGQFTVPPLGGGGSHTPQTSTGIPSIPNIGIVAGLLTFAVIVVIGIIFFIIGVVLFYFGSRMQLVLMDLVATQTNLVGPAWSRTAPRTWRWIGFKILAFFAIAIPLAIVAAVPAIFFFRTIMKAGPQPHVGAAFGTIALVVLALSVMILILVAALWLIRDFVLPFILFQDASIGDALRNAFAIIRYEPGPVAFYLFMKFVISLITGIAAELCIALCVFITAIPLGLIAGGLYFALRHAGPVGTAIMYMAFALLALVFVAIFFVLGLCIAGAVLIFYQAYALYFLGGRYPLLGAMLEPPPPAEFRPPLQGPAPSTV